MMMKGHGTWLGLETKMREFDQIDLIGGKLEIHGSTKEMKLLKYCARDLFPKGVDFRSCGPGEKSLLA